MRKSSCVGRLLALALLLCLTAACASSGGTQYSPKSVDLKPPSGGSSSIQHVVIVVQENRSFDNLFAGFPGADTQSYGYDSSGEKITLRPLELGIAWDIEHDAAGFLAACNGTGSYPGTDCQMNGFNNEAPTCGTGSYPACPFANPMYAYVPHNETKPYFDIAKQYVLADRMFASNFDGSSFVAHQYLIAAQASSTVNYPNSVEWGCYAGGSVVIPTLSQARKIQYADKIPPCFNNETLGDELDAAGLSWRFYTSALPKSSGYLWSAYAAISHIYNGSDWKKDVISPQTQFFNDVQAGDLPVVTWITPTCSNSDHASCATNHGGPSWVASIVNAIGKSKYWDSTAIFVTWDDYGGWYDHVGPQMLDYDGLGVRVPLLVVSPYAKKGHVSHVPYEFGSILRFVEDRFGLATLSESDARATSPADDCFDFSQAPRKFKKIRSPLNEQDILRQPFDPRPPDND
jgi:phospholipase C